MKYLKSTLFLFCALSVLIACSTDGSEPEENSSTNTTNTTVSSKETVPPVINIGELPKMTTEELRMARNTIFAKYGRVFQSKDLKEHFSQQSWYNERPAFKLTDMKESDMLLVDLIRRWEEKTKILWQEQADITGNGRYENCFVLYNETKGTFSIIINDFSEEFDHFWGQNENTKEAPAEWAKLKITLVDTDTLDGRKEIHIAQRFDDWEDPGTQNIFVAFDDGVQVTALQSTNYDAGKLTFNGDGTVKMQYAYCPEHMKEFRLQKARLVEFDESIGPMPKGGCAACFSGDAMIAISANQSKPLCRLQRGDAVLTFDEQTNQFSTTVIKRVLTIYHDEIYEISIGDQTIKTTDDHPFLSDKGWCSLAPDKTMRRYAYSNVLQLDTNTQLMGIHAAKNTISSIKKLTTGQITYTIESLEQGNSFIVNGLVVGTEAKRILAM